ncbi:hypothetical protein [Nocardia arthritidis]|uniref:Uncharacterized protein n=1 Tax=Nocardia arthritidis TaxID=228602 RepID=A0A6G9YE79_9NOCA|nr:hypothetical protein [Nocardia arthritidis]QIS11502.1 hypothetical protein F5544_18140 [Nocardia arthritidis]
MGKHSAPRNPLVSARLAMLSMTALITAAVSTENGPTPDDRATTLASSWTDLDTAPQSDNAAPPAAAAPTTDRIAAVAPATDPIEYEVGQPKTPSSQRGLPLTEATDPDDEASTEPDTTAVNTEPKAPNKSRTQNVSDRPATRPRHARPEPVADSKKAPDLGAVLSSIAEVLNSGSSAGGALAQALGSGSSALGTGSAAAAPVAGLISSGSTGGTGSAIAEPLGALAKALGSGSAALGTGSSSFGKVGDALTSGSGKKSSGGGSKVH